MDITPQANGIYIFVHADRVNIDATLDITDRVSKNVIRYESPCVFPEQQSPYLQYTPSDGRFYYYQTQVTGHRQNSSYQISGKLQDAASYFLNLTSYPSTS